jgi:hypothetical protein
MTLLMERKLLWKPVYQNWSENQDVSHDQCLIPSFKKVYIFILSFLHLLTCVYIVWATSLPPFPYPLLPGRTCSTLLFSNFVEEKTSEIVRKA